MRRLGALLVAAALALTGCIGAMAQGTPAMEHRGTADQRAQDAYPGAALVSVNAFEANRSMSQQDGSQEPWNGTFQDDTIGDGAAPAWVYEYRVDDATGYVVVVDEDGEVVHTERDDDVDEDQSPIEDWQITSIEAVEIVRDNNDTWTIDEDGVAFYHLSRENGTSNPVWMMGESHEDQGMVFARVDATTGEFLGLEAFSAGFGSAWAGPWGGSWGSGSGSGSGGGWGGGWGGWDNGSDGSDSEPYQEAGSFDGNLTLAEPTAEHAFEVTQRGHPELGVELTLDDPAASTVTATVTGPETELGTLQASVDDPGTVEWWDEPVRGEYTVTVELQEGAAQSYGIQWCADGQAYEGTDSPYGPDEIDVCSYVDGDGGPAPVSPDLER